MENITSKVLNNMIDNPSTISTTFSHSFEESRVPLLGLSTISSVNITTQNDTVSRNITKHTESTVHTPTVSERFGFSNTTSFSSSNTEEIITSSETRGLSNKTTFSSSNKKGVVTISHDKSNETTISPLDTEGIVTTSKTLSFSNKTTLSLLNTKETVTPPEPHGRSNVTTPLGTEDIFSTPETFSISSDKNVSETGTSISKSLGPTTEPFGNTTETKYTESEWRERRRRRKKLIRKLCRQDFIGAQGKRCCQKSIKCFGDLPELIDEIETYNNSEDQDDLQRQHVCQHIKNSMLCMGHAMALPVCKSSVTFVHRKLNDTLSDVTKFHAESCQKGSSTPTIIPSTTRHTAPPGGIGSRSGIKPHTHDHTNYAAIVGGVAGGLILVFLIVLIVLLLRKNKSKRPTSEFRVKDVDGDMNLSNGSSRYKNHIGLSRNHSEVYAEIDESSMHSNQSFPDKRPLPSAPSNGPISSDNTGYLTPRGSREALGLPNDRDSGGYHVLQKEANRKPSVDAYEKLHNEEGEYIEPTNNSDRRVRVPSQKPPKNNNQDVPKPTDDNYHMYFVLEKDSAVHV